ncbi:MULTISPECIES: aminotransferase class III-fold pyridoxal phosphate-dependent enzyme [unclassified Saccharicrinis]|uniref:aminotransferase class III-fold pyridoxal phosphate-dependent enzyme n=1 Tax=unclassified Saccharicrinis TaxID=2646859 RepID=UPI003D3261F3
MKEYIHSLYKAYARPLPVRLMEALKLDKEYIKAEQNYLYYTEGEAEIKVLDFINGYGCALLGHNHPDLLKYLHQLQERKIPVHTQLSIKKGTALLAKKINDLIAHKSNKEYITTLANSGSEAVEAAIKHAYLNYNNKLSGIIKKVESTLLNIKVHGQNRPFKITFNHLSYSTFEDFKNAIIKHNEKCIKNSPPLILASRNSYHGKTLAALSVTYREQYRRPFLSDNQTNNLFFDWDEKDVKKLVDENQFKLVVPVLKKDGYITIKEFEINRIAGLIIEPILGEGGVLPVPHPFLKFLREITAVNHIPLIFDEVQSGCFRTGTFLSSFKADVYADYYILGKALGGAMVKISALVVEREQYISEFGLNHTSTFAEDELSSLLAIKSLEIAGHKKEDIITKGNIIKEKLFDLKKEYPEIITDIRGEGLMIGIEFKDFSFSQSYGFQLLSRSGYLGYVISAWLLNRKNIRVSVPLSNTTTIRIHPSFSVTGAEIEHFINSLQELCGFLYYEDLYKLIDFMLAPKWQSLRGIQDYRHGKIVFEDSDMAMNKVGFLVHYIDLNTVKAADPSLKLLDDDTLMKLLHNLLPMACPLILGRKNIRNDHGDVVSITFSGLSFTSQMVKDAFAEPGESLSCYRRLCNNAIQILNGEFDISIIGLGQFTSILLKNGKLVLNSNVNITTGNSYTVYTAVQNIIKHIENLNLTNIKMAVIGAGGNIASSISGFLTNRCSEILLMGNHGKLGNKAKEHGNNLLWHIMKHLFSGHQYNSKLEEKIFNSQLYQKIIANSNMPESNKLWNLLQDELEDENPVKIIDNLDHCNQCDLIIVATNEAKPFLESKHFKKGAVICDISVPLNCTQELLNDDDITVIKGGIVTLPSMDKMPLKGFPLRQGEAYACISETLIMGFNNSNETYSFGPIQPQNVLQIGKIGNKYGFGNVMGKMTIP